MPFKKGDPNINRSGRPKKGTTLTDILNKQGDTKDVIGSNGKKIDRKQALATKLWSMAMSGDVAAVKYIYDRIDGKPLQSQEIDMSGQLDVALIKIKNNK